MLLCCVETLRTITVNFTLKNKRPCFYIYIKKSIFISKSPFSQAINKQDEINFTNYPFETRVNMLCLVISITDVSLSDTFCCRFIFLFNIHIVLILILYFMWWHITLEACIFFNALIANHLQLFKILEASYRYMSC